MRDRGKQALAVEAALSADERTMFFDRFCSGTTTPKRWPTATAGLPASQQPPECRLWIRREGEWQEVEGVVSVDFHRTPDILDKLYPYFARRYLSFRGGDLADFVQVEFGGDGPDAHSVRFSKINAEAEAEMAAWDEELRGRKK